ncbi:hypothetical protein ABT024_05090 [Streptomyces sp. NPDC002812]|uniref:hypothetical protein n=1 Tax=Streptomyces sp. NPDC002812 TaxID=3154434 RepID=UPI003331386A
MYPTATIEVGVTRVPQLPPPAAGPHAAPAPTSPGLNATVRLRIENRYADGAETVTTPVVTVPLPLPVEDTTEREDWEWEHILGHSGTGPTNVHGWYDIKIIESTAPELLGLTFDFGY